jgi:hypothetical protein
VESFHSKDFRYCLGNLESEPQIGGKTQAQWEANFNAVGAIEHLKGLGWSNYQWRYVSSERIDKNVAEFGHKLGCFAEFFGPCYHGYLRGDGDTVAAAIIVCLNRAQKMAECEVRTGHTYDVPTGYNNGFIRCELCGFNGFTPQVDSLKSTVRNLQIHIKVMQEQHIATSEAIRKAGLRWSMKDFMGTLERIPKVKKDKHAG